MMAAIAVNADLTAEDTRQAVVSYRESLVGAAPDMTVAAGLNTVGAGRSRFALR